ncbi:Metallo-beta-lactamase superfamily protein [Streptomyces sp. OK228]|nr:Metallo-beta-lactamase superfamily protein [Streptomyces sp. OK228]
MGKNTAVRRLDLGYFIRPASETGGPQPRVEPVLAYLVQHDQGLILFDTGIGNADRETEAHYRPQRRALQEALSAAGVTLGDISLVVNCHLHFDHCGGNPLLGGKPILVQEAELAAARRGNYTIDELVDFPGATRNSLVRPRSGRASGSSRHPGTPKGISRWSFGKATAL